MEHHMNFIANLPFLSIILTLVSGPVTLLLNKNGAKYLSYFVVLAVTVMTSFVFTYTLTTGQSIVYMMGHYPAPWGNEIRFSMLESGICLFWCIVMFLSLIAGEKERDNELYENRSNLFYVFNNLLLTSLLALSYTNDLFTAYVFIEINTIAGCGLVMIKKGGRRLVATTKYIIMSCLGSTTLLFGIAIIYACTGHLLMTPIYDTIQTLYVNKMFMTQITVAVAMMVIGIAVKSSLFPFHSWLPDVYGYATVSSAAVLSSLVSKAYIFLLIKIFMRVIGLNVIGEIKILNVLFILGLAGMIYGSLCAIKEKKLNRMVAYSSVAQIGYIYMGLGLGNIAGIVAAIFHIISHGASKSLLFVAQDSLRQTAGSRNIDDMKGAAHQNMWAGVAFTVGGLSMVGIPMFAGFISKYLFTVASLGLGYKMWLAIATLALSTLLNAVYFMKVVMVIWYPTKKEEKSALPLLKKVAFVGFIVMNFVLGLNSPFFIKVIEKGLSLFI